MEKEPSSDAQLTEDQRRALDYLDMIGMKDMANQPMPNKEDKTVKDFLEFCGEHVTPVFEGLKSGIQQDDPDVKDMIQTLRQVVSYYAGQSEPMME